MDIYELRRKTHVRDYYLDNIGAVITYVSITQMESVIKLNRQLVLAELIAIGSLDESIHDEKIFETYELSQWDALNIAIRFEQAREMDKEIDNSDIGKAIKKITNGQGDAY